MYLRKTTRKNKDGSQVSYLALAHNEWDAEKGYSKPKIIHNFGRTDQLDEDALHRLVQGICRYLGPEDLLKYEALLEGRGEVGLENRKTLGGSWVLDQLWKDLGIQDVLRRTLETREFRTPVERLIFAMVANGALAPKSKLAWRNGCPKMWPSRAWRLRFTSCTGPWTFSCKAATRSSGKSTVPSPIH